MKCIKMSRKTVLVLSPDFLRSPWCGYEMQIVLREHLFREEKVVIPVLLHDCIIPDFISHLTYLEVQDPQFWEKFLEILKTDNTENETLSGLFSFGHEADKFNGKTIARFSSNLDSSDVYNTLSSSGIRVTKEDIDCAFGTLRKTSLYRYCYRCFISKAIVMSSVYASMAMMAYILTQTIIYFVLLLLVGSPPWAIGLKSDPTSFVIYCLVIVLEIVLIASFFKVRRMRDEAERAVNYYLLSYDIIMGYMGTDHSSMQMLHVVYFKSSKCLDTLERYLKAYLIKVKFSKSSGTLKEDSTANNDTSNSENSPMLDTSDLESRTKVTARIVIAEICGNYVRDVNCRSLRNPVRGQRHTRQGLCLCQYVESEMFEELV